VTDKSQIKSYRQISNHSINRFKSFGRISNLNPIFSSNLKSSSNKSQIEYQIFNFRFKLDTSVYLFFHNIKNSMTHKQWVSDHSQSLQYS